jgi:hypothetical protein
MLSLAMLTSMGLVHLTTYLMGAERILERVAQAREALPTIVNEEKPQVMVFGSSMVEAGFAPRLFDQQAKAQGKDIKSYNFGFGGLNPYFQDMLSARISQVYQQNDKRLKLAIIEFNPFQTTQTRWNRAKALVDSYITVLGTDDELWQVAKQDLTRGMLMYNIKYIRQQLSAEMITSFFGKEMFPSKRATRVKDTVENDAKRKELRSQVRETFEADYPDYHGKRWYLAWQGGGTIAAERPNASVELYGEYMKLMQTDARMTNYRQRRVETADVLDLNFEPLLVESFIGIIENFKQFSDKVEVIMLPRNTKWINYSPEARARLDKTIAQIEAATGVSIRDHQEIKETNPQMFRDATHLARYTGDVVYTRYLLNQYLNDI